MAEILKPEQAPPRPAPAAAATPPAGGPAARAPVRRVGSVTLGLALVATGLVITASLFWPGFDLLTAAKLAPLVLVALGAETLWACARKGDARLRFDLLSGFFAFLLICASLTVSLIPFAARYFGPERHAAERRFAGQIAEQLWQELKGEDILDCHVSVDLMETPWQEGMTLDRLGGDVYVSASLTLGGECAGGGEFAARAATILPALREAGVDSAFFALESGGDRWQLDLDGVFGMNAGAARLESLTLHQQRAADGDGGYFWQDAPEAALPEAAGSGAQAAAGE